MEGILILIFASRYKSCVNIDKKIIFEYNKKWRERR